jgi:catechol 2,3-dioxygenase-like lactoylglutathione lyase family enzyme
LKVTGLDHIVLLTPDPERALTWYTEVVGLTGERVEQWRRGEAPFPSVRVDAGTIIDLFEGERVGANLDHFCLVTSRQDWEEALAAGRFPVERGPSRVFGARGLGTSVYTRDPDGNLVELRYYET